MRKSSNLIGTRGNPEITIDGEGQVQMESISV